MSSYIGLERTTVAVRRVPTLVWNVPVSLKDKYFFGLEHTIVAEYLPGSGKKGQYILGQFYFSCLFPLDWRIWQAYEC